MEAGEFSNVPSKPHSGILGILIKHREQLEPSNRIQGNLATQQLALARALAEILDGLKPSESTVNVTFDMAEVAKMIKPLAEKMAEVVGNVERLGAELNQTKEDHERFKTSALDKICELQMRLIQLEHPAPIPDHVMDIKLNPVRVVESHHDLIQMLSDDGPKGLIELIGAEVASRSESVDSLVVGLSDQGKSPSEILKSVNEVFPPLVPSGRVGGRRRIE